MENKGIEGFADGMIVDDFKARVIISLRDLIDRIEKGEELAIDFQVSVALSQRKYTIGTETKQQIAAETVYGGIE